jgi:hypothetical protein
MRKAAVAAVATVIVFGLLYAVGTLFCQPYGPEPSDCINAKYQWPY